MTTLGELAAKSGRYLALAESLTGGLVSAEVVSEAGASNYFLGSIVSYSDLTKVNLLGVAAEKILNHSAVSAEVALEMAIRARKSLAVANGLEEHLVIALSTTGVAGPDPVGENPVGLVFFGISSERGERFVRAQFQGGRNQVREAAKLRAMELIREELTAVLG